MPTNVQLVFETDARKSLAQQKKLKDDLRSVEKTAKDSQEKVRGEFNKTTDTIRKVGTALGVTFGAAIILKGIRDTMRTLKEFETSLAGLRSITGMTAKDMVFMKDKAIELSKASTKSAKEVVEAFKLVGSAKPELLKSASALAEVTKQAIILAEAGGITVPEAAMALTGALNMFGKSAKDAAEFTDILATSQQKGSAFIASLAEAMINAGSVASALGMSFETTNAVLQGFAKGGLQGSRAGMAFSIVMNKLANQADKSLNPAFTDTNQLLDNLAAKNLTVEQASKLVGEEASKYLLTLIKQKGIVQELNGTLSEHGNALEQARINTDTLDTSMKNVGKAWDNFVLSVKTEEGALNTALRNIAENITLMIESLTYEYKPEENVIDVLEGFKQGIKDLEKEAKAEAIIHYMENIKLAWAALPSKKDWEEKILAGMGIRELKKEQKFVKDMAESYRLMYDELEKYLDEVRSGTDIIYDFDDDLIIHKKTVKEIAKEYKTLFDIIKAGLEDTKEAKEGDAKADKEQADWIFDFIDKKKKAKEDADKAEREAAERRMEQEDKDRETRVEKEEADLEKKNEAEIKAEEEKKRLKEEIIRGAFDVASGFVDFLSAKNQNAMDEELRAAGDNEAKKEEIKRKYARKDQNMAVMRAIMGGAEGIVKTFAEYGFTPPGIAASIALALVTAFQIATIKAQKFATGTLDIKGRGTGTSDSIPAMISKGESVMTAKETHEYFPYLKAMKEGNFFRFQEEMVDKIAAFKAVTNNNLNYDNSKELKKMDEMIKALKEKDTQEYIDGKYKIIKRGNITTRISLN